MLDLQTETPLSIMPNLKLKPAASAEEASPLLPLSLANLLEEGRPSPCFRRTTTTKQYNFRPIDSLLSHFSAGNVFAVSATFTKQLLPRCALWSQKNVLLLWSVTQILTTRFLRGTRIRGKAAWANLPPDLCREIGIRLASRLDILRFRSVCKNWRSSLPPPIRFPLRVPPPPNCYLEFCNMPYYITEVSIAINRSSIMAFEEVDQGGKFRAFFILPREMKFDYPTISFMGSPKHSLSQLSLVSKAYHLRMAFPRSESDKKRDKGQWDLRYNKFAKKMVIIYSTADDGVNPIYARTSDLCVVAHLSWGTMYRRLALLRLGGGKSHENLEWDTNFCTQVFIDITTYKGRLCALDPQGAVFLMDYNSLQMNQIAPPSSVPHDLVHKELFEAFGDLYLADTMSRGRSKVYKLSLRNQNWLKVEDIGKVIPALMPFHIYDNMDDI